MIFFDRKWIWLQELEKLSLYTDVRIELGTIENCRTIHRCEDIELYRSSINEITLIIEIKRKINKENTKKINLILTQELKQLLESLRLIFSPVKVVPYLEISLVEHFIPILWIEDKVFNS